jgi:hypothetical protein
MDEAARLKPAPTRTRRPPRRSTSIRPVSRLDGAAATVASTNASVAGVEPSLRFQAKNEDAATPFRRQNAATDKPLARCRPTRSRHLCEVEDASLLITRQSAARRTPPKDAVQVTLTFRYRSPSNVEDPEVLSRFTGRT